MPWAIMEDFKVPELQLPKMKNTIKWLLLFGFYLEFQIRSKFLSSIADTNE